MRSYPSQRFFRIAALKWRSRPLPEFIAAPNAIIKNERAELPVKMANLDHGRLDPATRSHQRARTSPFPIPAMRLSAPRSATRTNSAAHVLASDRPSPDPLQATHDGDAVSGILPTSSTIRRLRAGCGFLASRVLEAPRARLQESIMIRVWHCSPLPETQFSCVPDVCFHTP